MVDVSPQIVFLSYANKDDAQKIPEYYVPIATRIIFLCRVVLTNIGDEMGDYHTTELLVVKCKSL